MSQDIKIWVDEESKRLFNIAKNNKTPDPPTMQLIKEKFFEIKKLFDSLKGNFKIAAHYWNVFNP